MNILIIGGGGLVGQKLGQALAAKGTLRGKSISRMVLADIVDPAPIAAGFDVAAMRCDISDAASVAGAVTADIDVIYLLAAIVSGHAEADFEAGLNINLHGTLNVLERCRALSTAPVVIFTSSAAIYGGEALDPVGDHTFPNPQTSYGTQKAVGELLLNDYSRRGFIDGRAFRLPTISVRPGAPNRAASSFMSSIIREPLNGLEAVCPVRAEFEHYYLSPRKCIENLILGAELDGAAIGMNRVMQMPGRRHAISDLIAAMTAVAGPAPATLIRWERQPGVEAIVKGWRFDVAADKALRLGLTADDSFEDNVRNYIADDMPKA